jgi:hypothetical protein
MTEEANGVSVIGIEPITVTQKFSVAVGMTRYQARISPSRRQVGLSIE